MNGESVILKAEAVNFSINNTENEKQETQIFEAIQIESLSVSEIKTKNKGTRFARLKKVLRKRSAGIL